MVAFGVEGAFDGLDPRLIRGRAAWNTAVAGHINVQNSGEFARQTVLHEQALLRRGAFQQMLPPELVGRE